MAKKKKTEKYYPIVVCGAFYTTDSIRDLIQMVLGAEYENVKDEIDLDGFMSVYFENVDYSKSAPYIKEILCIKSEDIYDPDEELVEGYLIGIPLFGAPEHMSMKRLTIDMRQFLENNNLLPEESHPDTVKIYSKILKVTDE